MKGCRAFTDDEIQRIVVTLSRTRDRGWFLLGLYTGFRITELLQFQVKTVYQHNTILDEVYLSRQYMKRKREGRVIALTIEAKHVIQQLLDDVQAHGSVFPTRYLFQSQKGNNKPITRIQAGYILKAACAQLGITGKIGTHSMRKTFSLKLYQLTGDIYKVQQALGHKNPGTTLNYLPTDREAIREAMSHISYGINALTQWK